MAEKKLDIYICSNVGIDYFFFLGRTIATANYNVKPIYLVSESSYRKLAKTSGVKKIWLRINMYLFYPFLLVYKALFSKRNSVFVVTSNGFFAPYLVYLCLKLKSGKVIHLLYDLYPDAIEIAGIIKPDSFSSKMIGKIMHKNLIKCNATVYLGEFLKKHAEKRWGEAPISDTIDISTDLDLYESTFNSEIATGKIILHYGGQLGHLHDASSLIASIKYVCHSDISKLIEFNFYVSGAQAQFLEESLKGYPVKVISAVPSSQWRKDINNFHIGMVSLSTGGASVCLPSKTYGMMAGGMAILAICPEWSDLAKLVRDLNAGWVINNSKFQKIDDFGDRCYLDKLQETREEEDIAHDFYQKLKLIIENKQELNDRRKNAYDGVRYKHNIKDLSLKWSNIIKRTFKN